MRAPLTFALIALSGWVVSGCHESEQPESVANGARESPFVQANAEAPRDGDSADTAVAALASEGELPLLHELIVIGREPAAHMDGELGMVSMGRMSPSGEYVVVADRASPHIRVYQKPGTFVAAMGRKGAGPGEISFTVTALAVTDSTVHVFHDGRYASVFDLTGRYLGRSELPGITPIAAQSCGWDIVVYGPSTESHSHGPGRWFHRIRQDATGATEIVTSAYEDVVPGAPAFGRPSALVNGDDGLVARHGDDRQPRFLSVDCASDSAGLRVRELPTPADVAWGQLPTGIAVANRTIYAFDAIYRGGPRTRVHALDEAGYVAAVTPADYVALDSRPDIGVLLLSTEPVPVVLLVSQGSFTDFVRGHSMPLTR